MVIGFAAFSFLGYVVFLVPARRCHLDIGSFRRSLRVGYGNRDRWPTGIVLAYLAFGLAVARGDASVAHWDHCASRAFSGAGR